jgi:hypothetical protein
MPTPRLTEPTVAQRAAVLEFLGLPPADVVHRVSATERGGLAGGREHRADGAVVGEDVAQGRSRNAIGGLPCGIAGDAGGGRRRACQQPASPPAPDVIAENSCVLLARVEVAVALENEPAHSVVAASASARAPENAVGLLAPT